MSCQEYSRAPKRDQEDPSYLGIRRRAEELPREHRRYQESRETDRRAQELPGEPRSSQDSPGATKRRQEARVQLGKR